MLVEAITAYISKYNSVTLTQIAQAVQLDEATAEFALQKLIAAQIIVPRSHKAKNNECCSTKKCSTCPMSKVSTYYSLAQEGDSNP